MLHQTATLTGHLFDAAIAQAQGLKWSITEGEVFANWATEEQGMAPYHPTGQALGLSILKAQGIPYSGDLEADLRGYVVRVFGESVDLDVSGQ